MKIIFIFLAVFILATFISHILIFNHEHPCFFGGAVKTLLCGGHKKQFLFLLAVFLSLSFVMRAVVSHLAYGNALLFSRAYEIFRQKQHNFMVRLFSEGILNPKLCA